jgi:hypothetical protein
MATMSSYYTECDTYKPKNHFFRNLFILMFIGIALAVCIHALEKHGTEADIVDKCIQSKGILGTWIRPADQHVTKICQVDNKFGLKIDDKDGNNLTAFIYNAHNRIIKIATVLQYLHNVGYEPFDDLAKGLEMGLLGR